MGLRSFLSFSLVFSFVLLYPFHPKFVAQAEISLPRTTDRFYRLEVTPVEARVTRKSTETKVSPKVDDSSKVLRASETRSDEKNDQQVGNETQSGTEAPIAIYPNPNSGLKIAGKKYGNILEDNQARSTERMASDDTFSVTRKKAKRNVDATYVENVDRSISGEAHSIERFAETVQGVSNSRAEYRRGGEEARGSNPRQNEPHLDTSTFALSGDSAHNQAMVHWSGHNSSVSFSFHTSSHHKGLSEHHIPPTRIKPQAYRKNVPTQCGDTFLRTTVPLRTRVIRSKNDNISV